ncbi:Gfo/Idh/MocA family protein [Flindersiella endophytica]
MKSDSAPRPTGADQARDQAKDQVGVVVVGTGGIAAEHLAALSVSRRARLAGVVDADAGRARAASIANGGTPWTTSLDEALAWPETDGCIVCTPNDTHAPLGIRIAAAGKHLLLEKPLATTVDDAIAVRDAFRAAGSVVAAAHTHRAYDYSRAVKQVVDSGEIGTPRLIRLAFLGSWLWGDWRAWVLDPERSGGHALHNGVHLLDTVTWWMGERPESVYARGRKLTGAELRIFDYLELTVEYPGGRVAVCEMSRAHQPAGFGQRDVLLVGSAGTIRQAYDGEAGQVFGSTTGAGPSAIAPVSGAGGGFVLQLEAWLDGIDGGAALASADDGVLSVALGVAAEQSMLTGQPVRLAEVLP